MGCICFVPDIIEPLHGVQSKTRSYRMLYSVSKPLLSLLRILLPRAVLTTDMVGLAMLEVARYGAPKSVLEAADIADLANKPVTA